MNELHDEAAASRAEQPANDARSRLSGHAHLTRAQYLLDIGQYGYADARLLPRGNMTLGRRGVLDVGDRSREVRPLPRRRRATAAADSNLRGAARCPTPVRPFADGPFRLPPS